MSKANTVGSLFEENYLKKNFPSTGTTAITIVSPPLDDIDGISFQIVTGDYVQPLIVTAADTVGIVTVVTTYTFANGAFVAAMVGGTITISGAVAAGNNGTFTIAGVTSATVITVTTSTQVAATFAGTENVTVTLTSDPIQAAFTVEISDNYSRGGISGMGQVANTGDWGAVTSKFANTGSPFFPAIAAITADGAPYYQMTPLVGRFVRWVITPTDGTGNLSFLYSAKGNR
jgi:hypothetical protein